MKNKLLTILFIGLAQLNAQSKKEQIQNLNSINDSLSKLPEIERKINSKIQKPNNFCLAYRHGKIKDPIEEKEFTTVFLNFKNKNFVVTDSIISNINDTELCFYFLTPLESEINLQCPNEYGIIILNRDNKEIYSLFWDGDSNAELKGNCLPGLNQFKTNNGTRNFLCLGNSGCGSGTSITYYDIKYLNEKIQFKESFSGVSGYSEFQFIPKKNIYLKIEKMDPECHYSCPSKYTISTYSLTDDKLIKSNTTKLMYEDYNDIGIKNLIKNIRNKEANILLD